MKVLFAILAGCSLMACLVLPWLYFQGVVVEAAYKDGFLLASVGWFTFGTLATR